MGNMETGFDLSDLTEFQQKLLLLAQKKMPKETKAFMRREGSKLLRRTQDKVKKKLGIKTGNYYASIRRGRPYDFGDALSIRVYSYAPHSHLIEYGHRQIEKHRRINIDGEYVTLKRFPEERETGFVPGRYIFEETRKEFESEFARDAQGFLDKMLEKGLS